MVWGTEVPQCGPGANLGSGSGDEVLEKLKQNVKLAYNF